MQTLEQRKAGRMSRLIDGDTLIEKIKYESSADGAYGYMDTKSIVDCINDAPTIEPERKTGKWIYASMDDYKCSVCGEIVRLHKYQFCPNCGCDMRGDSNDRQM